MLARDLKSVLFVLAICVAGLLPSQLWAQGDGSGTAKTVTGAAEPAAAVQPVDLEIYITDTELAALAPKAQMALSKAIGALSSNKLPDARSQLETAYSVAPTSAEVNYLFGVYSLRMNDRVQAKSYWTKTLELHPEYFRALLSLSRALLDDNNVPEALVYLDRAVKVEPSSWRAHSIYADAYLRNGSLDEAIQHAERALELGHGQAVGVQLYLAAALAKRGERDKAKAAAILQAYVEEHPGDIDAKKQLENLESNAAQNMLAVANAGSAATALPAPSNWLPADVDERVPPVEAGAVCALDDVVQKAGQRIQEFIVNVDRFVATEYWKHQSINKRGVESGSEKRKYDYLVSIHEMKPGLFDVQELRRGSGDLGGYPDGVESRGLPALVLIFHPDVVGNFDLTCEGLARHNGVLSWQVHFRQRADKPNNLRAYKLGMNGSSYPVAVKGRAWIAADSYQLLSMETDLVKPIPEIRLIAEHTTIEYGPVTFRERKVDMWLPQSAEVYSDWRGKRFHRRHSFDKYLLFSVDDKQTISAPKAAAEMPPNLL
jgi:tetratricopeptide (TPR) repeat protein